VATPAKLEEARRQMEEAEGEVTGVEVGNVLAAAVYLLLVLFS
jgi:hypothetical protein